MKGYAKQVGPTTWECSQCGRKFLTYSGRQTGTYQDGRYYQRLRWLVYGNATRHAERCQGAG